MEIFRTANYFTRFNIIKLLFVLLYITEKLAIQNLLFSVGSIICFKDYS